VSAMGRVRLDASEPIELVIFDCDGVLVDSERIAIKVDVEVLAGMGCEISEQECIERFLGLSDASFRQAVESLIGKELPDNWDLAFQPRYRELLAAELRPVEGILDALDRIALPTCIASSGSHDKMRFTLGLTKLYERFAGRIFSATEVRRGKPEPDLFLHVAERMGVAPARCAVIEDSVNGVRAARAAGMRVYGYAGGLTAAAKLAGERTTVFERMQDLPDLLRAMEEGT
jgi:HAD superfamily hydrolase (TIGR01509 family)